MIAVIHGNSPYSLSPLLFPDILNSKPSAFLIPHLIGPSIGGGGVTGGPTGGGGCLFGGFSKEGLSWSITVDSGGSSQHTSK